MRTAIEHTTTERYFLPILDNLAEHLPNELVARLRTRLAQGHVVEVAHAIVFAAVARPLALTGAEIDLLIITLAGAGEETAMARTIQRAEVTPPRRGGVTSFNDAQS